MAQQRDRSKDNSQTASDAAVRTTSSCQAQYCAATLAGSPKQIPAKCVRCAMLSMAEVRSQHGEAGDNCYVSEVCRSRRSYVRHQRSRNQARRQQHQQRVTGVQANRSAAQPSANLIVYRLPRYGAPVDSLAASVQQGKTKSAIVQPIYCAGLVPQQIYACLEAILAVLQRDYGIAHFANVVQRLPQLHLESQFSKSRSRKGCGAISPRCRQISIALPDVTDRYSAVLLVYRQLETEAVVAIKVEVWRGATPEAEIPLLDCQGLLPSQIHAYLTQVLALLNLRYAIRWFARQVEHSSELCRPLLESVESSADSDSNSLKIDLDPLWQTLDEQLQQPYLVPRESLEVAASGITEIVSQFAEFAALTFEELEAVAERGVMLPADAFDRYVRQSIEVDFERFIEPIATLSRKPIEKTEVPDDGRSIVGELDQAALLQALDQQMSQEPGLTEVEAFNRAIQMAHDEDVSAWTGAIEHWMAEQSTREISFSQLQQSIDLPLIPMWLALLLGGYGLEQRGEFYDGEQIWVVGSAEANQIL